MLLNVRGRYVGVSNLLFYKNRVFVCVHVCAQMQDVPLRKVETPLFPLCIEFQKFSAHQGSIYLKKNIQ